MPPPLLICDFDGTLTTVDVGDALCDRFAPATWREVDERWLRNEISLPEAQRRMWAMVRATRQELVAHAREVGTLRAGAEDLLAAAAAGAVELVVASGGFDLYIEAILGEHRRAVSATYHNRLHVEGDRAEPRFLEGMGCARCAVCKGEVLRRHRAPGRRVAFCGDGASDRCAAAVAPELFTVRGSHLAAHCDGRGVDHVQVDDLREVLASLLGE